jgi:hypothetical protein
MGTRHAGAADRVPWGSGMAEFAALEGLVREDTVLAYQLLCSEWVGRILEAHMTTLVVDDIGSVLLTQLLATVRVHRRRAEAVSPLVGMVCHIAGSRPLPDASDNMYSKSILQVPAFAAMAP